ncbi:4a-hydroxytetrahydrobiopterin dehydratase [Janthinobacterium lividum]|uniref:4a-hydroxytetrahydrobiopterin dehydratase n=1 Tax=Janthinobacterium lividum TaxID=29581 RepID=UPI0009BDBFE0|nr:4a-hydroxytetrahydrobiopterin dehydratase [Janthinobacterium lividum]
MHNKIFVNYRHSDAQHAAIAIAETLRWTFADGEVFFDRTSIQGGEVWPKTIRTALEHTTVLVVIIGQDWLKACDQYARRKIDHPDDWVRQEIARAIERGIVIVPVILDKAHVPPIEALDESLHLIAHSQIEQVRVDSWESDLARLIARLKVVSHAKVRAIPAFPNGIPIPRPARVQKEQQLLTPEELDEQVADVSGWVLESNYHPWAAGGQATELARVYEFPSFASAVSFMDYAAKEINKWKPQHHPRWENQWRSVKVWFTTWDVGCRVTELDILSAKRTDALFVAFMKKV